MHRLEAYATQGKGHLGKVFFFSSFGLLFACYSLCSSTYGALGPSVGGPVASPAPAGEAHDDLEPAGSEDRLAAGEGPWAEPSAFEEGADVLGYVYFRGLLV